MPEQYVLWRLFTLLQGAVVIKQLRIQNFRSLRDVTFDLQRVNLLIGPNNCGKTNVLKALRFFSNYLHGEYPDYEQFLSVSFLDENLHRLKQLAFNRPHPLIALWVQPLPTRSDSQGIGVIEVAPSWEEYPTCKITAGVVEEGYNGGMVELVNINTLDDHSSDWEAIYSNSVDEEFLAKIAEVDKHNNNIKKPYAFEFFRKPGHKAIMTSNIDATKPTAELASVGALLFAYYTAIKIYQPDPNTLKEPYPSRSEDKVSETASNLIAFLQEMRNKYPDIYNRIISDLQRFVPEYEAISFEYVELPENDALRVKYGPKSYSFYKLGLIDKYKRTFWAEDLSEGILYFLALLAIIHQPNPPKMLLLEEPEKGIHPRRIREVLDLIFELAEEKDIQVIMTTHSPLVVDRFSDIPESVFVLEKPENETIVKNLQHDVIEPMNAKFREAGEEPIPYTEALGEHWAMGFLGGVPDERL